MRIIKSKLILLSVLVLISILFTLLWWIDDNKEIVFVTKVTPQQITANGKDVATVTVKVTNTDGTARSGDNLLLIKMKGHGALKVSRIQTDEKGMASFEYYSYRASSYTPPMLNIIQLTDDSVGKIIGVYKRFAVEIPVVKPIKEEDTKSDNNKNNKNDDGYIELGGGN